MADRLVMLERGLCAAILGLFLAGCPQRSEPPPPPAEPVETDPPAPTIPTPTALSRADLLAAARQAASAYALGQTSGADSLAGRTFAILTPVGCGGPLPALPQESADGLARIAWGPERRTLLFSLTPGDWTESPLIAGASADWESVEGVWLPRPWLEGEGCPTVTADPLGGGAAASAQTIGLAVVHSEDDSRLNRRDGRAWTFAIRGEGEAAPVVQPRGWRVRLEGRMAAFPDGRSFRCRASGPDAAPVCVAAVQLDRVALESADGSVLSEWRDG